MKRIIFIIICGILVIPSILGSFFDALPYSPKFLNPNNDSIINFIPTKIIHRYFCITSLSYIDTTFYSVEVQYTKNKKIGGFQGISVKTNGTRSFAFRCGFDDYGGKKYIKGDTIQVRYVESWIKKLNIDSLINNNYTIYSPIANLYGYWFGYFTMPLTTDTINKTIGYIDIHRSDSIEFCYFERDYLGSIRAVTDADGRLLQSVDYHVSGNPVVNVVSDRQATNRLHTGKEFQPFQGVALYDNLARYYDPIGSKFLTMDPLCEKYPSLSPYSHCANNPLSIIDPDGMEIIMPKGTSKQNIYTVMNNLQTLTDDRLVYKTQTDGTIRIKIASLGKGNKISGTNLIRQLNSSDKTMTINVVTEGGNSAKYNKSNAINGTKTDVSVNFDINADPKIYTKSVNGEINIEGRPAQIGLAHELIHGLRVMGGNAINYNNKIYNTYTDPKGNNITENAPIEELETIGIYGTSKITENSIRNEQNQNIRISYETP